MGEIIELPESDVQLKKAYIYTGMTEQKEVYLVVQKTVAGAMPRVLLIKNGIRLLRRITVLIYMHRLLLILCVSLLILAFLWSWWFLLGIPSLFLIGVYVLSPLQISANVELAARLYVLDELIVEDAELRERV